MMNFLFNGVSFVCVDQVDVNLVPVDNNTPCELESPNTTSNHEVPVKKVDFIIFIIMFCNLDVKRLKLNFT